MTDPNVEERIRDLARRVAREPGSRYFVPLAEELRKSGRLPDAVAALETGLAVHPSYVAARIALARALLEAGRIEESIAEFSRALVDDPSNLVAAKALGDLHLSRGEPIEALKRYLLYRAISGDRRLDGTIARLEKETARSDEPPPRAPAPESPPPPPFVPSVEPAGPPPAAIRGDSLPRVVSTPAPPPAPAPAARHTDPYDITSVPYRRPSTGSVPVVAGPEAAIPSRDVSFDSLTSGRKEADDNVATRKIRLPEATWPFEAAPQAPEPSGGSPPLSEPLQDEPPPPGSTATAEPAGRALADLYFEQGHYGEALSAYDGLLAGDPSDDEVVRLRDEAARRLGEESSTPALPLGDPDRERRLEKIRLLNEWRNVVRRTRDKK